MKLKGTLVVIGLMALLLGCSEQKASESSLADSLQLPENFDCAKYGGSLEVETQGSGQRYGVCQFEDNRQCEAWAMVNGRCPQGGLKVAGYVTSAAVFCAITGGSYQVSAKSNTPQEQGTCSLSSGTVCDVWKYYNGTCGTTGDSGSAAAR
ncbi:Uncharacterised protein [BD1-7 clade bacterium]|uniref:DUF333 domain-containing protein n=1 Tax=BD1-7 clade bacterium TaxID=2029982 RepID=A0A5S9Q0B5_9GAMM|nr:Uncharacterised protein [BD1-7 clade bacterium]CAA0112542.1 Uncharacterised protein [BD1-7 clade bacterium]